MLALPLPIVVVALLAPPPPRSFRVDLASVSDYRVATGWVRGRDLPRPVVGLRVFSLDGERQRLVVDPETLATRVVPLEQVDFESTPWCDVRAALSATPYGRALSESESCREVRLGAGITHTRATGGLSLTVDLCPSRHPLESELFSSLIRELESVERPVPVGLAITGSWMRTHARDLEWLRSLERDGHLAITWINHSYSHRVDPGAPPERNFLLEPGTDVEREVLSTEAALIDRGITPSVFFRFPGLVSSPALVDRIIGFGLLPTGSDAWLGKGERPHPGSIVLVHGTGNERVGVERFLSLLRRKRADVRARRWLLLDLRESVAASEAGVSAPADAPTRKEAR